jgi:hypothetical protein
MLTDGSRRSGRAASKLTIDSAVVGHKRTSVRFVESHSWQRLVPLQAFGPTDRFAAEEITGKKRG